MVYHHCAVAMPTGGEGTTADGNRQVDGIERWQPTGQCQGRWAKGHHAAAGWLS